MTFGTTRRRAGMVSRRRRDERAEENERANLAGVCERVPKVILPSDYLS